MQTRLGDLYQRLGLTAEAMRQFQEAAEVCQSRGMKSEAFELLKRIAGLDPTNISNRLSLADLLAREGMESDAGREFESLLRDVESADPDERLRVATRAHTTFPRHLPFCLGLAAALCDAGSGDEAIELLERERLERGDDIPLREALVWVLQSQGKTENVRGVWCEIAELYKQRGDHDRARDILQRFVPVQGLGEPETSPSIVLQEELVESFDEGLEAPTPAPDAGSPKIAAASAPSAQASPETQPSGSSAVEPEEILAEVRVALEFGSLEEAAAGLERVLASVPDCDEANALGALVAEGRGQIREALEIQGRRRALALSLGDAEKVTEIEAEIARLESLGGEGEADPISLGALPDIEIILDDEQDHDSDWASVTPPAGLVASGDSEAETEPAESWELDLDPDAEVESPEAATAARPMGPDALDADITESGDDALEVVEAERSEASWADESSHIAESLVAAEALLAGGDVTAAEASYRAVLREIPNHPQALVRMGEIAARRGESPELPGASAPEAAAAPDPILELDPEPELAPEGEAAVEADPVLDPDPSPDPDPAPEGGDFDLAAELSQALEPAGGEPEAGGTSGRGFDSVLEAFKEGIREQLGPEECDARYDLAIAYREMGLLDDAVESLSVAIQGGARRLESLSLLAACEIDLGRPESAIARLDSGLAELAPDDPVALAFRYERASALQAAGRQADALAGYREVAARDPDYRDTAARISELEKLQD
ncbi:MAG: tetratricopeptide repeat protein [Myxococcota bacterium]